MHDTRLVICEYALSFPNLEDLKYKSEQVDQMLRIGLTIRDPQQEHSVANYMQDSCLTISSAWNFGVQSFDYVLR